MSDVTPIRKAVARPVTDPEPGIAWWNAMTPQARLAALKAVEPEGRASPAEAWAQWKETAIGFKCEGGEHA
jgi:hypothetical protein